MLHTKNRGRWIYEYSRILKSAISSNQHYRTSLYSLHFFTHSIFTLALNFFHIKFFVVFSTHLSHIPGVHPLIWENKI